MRPIDADDLKKRIELTGTPKTPYEIGYFDSRDIAIDCIDEAPTIDADQLQHGQWIFICEETRLDGWTYRKYKCSECGFETIEAKNFCNNCGSKMDGGADHGCKEML